MKTNQEAHMIDELTEQLEELKLLDRRRFDIVIARSHCDDIMTALAEAGVSKSWYYLECDETERARLDRLADQLHYAHVIKAQYRLQELLVEAVDVLGTSMRERDKRVRLDAAKYVLDAAGVKQPTKTEVRQTGNVTIRVEYDDSPE